MSNYQTIKVQQAQKLAKAIQHLEYSYSKVVRLATTVAVLGDEELEVWESFAARFSRVVDLFLKRYLRTCVLLTDPGFEGTLRDFINYGEKLGIIENPEEWMALRELRNITVHDYTEEELHLFFERIRQYCPRLLDLKRLLKIAG
jgi:hypothetical protein